MDTTFSAQSSAKATAPQPWLLMTVMVTGHAIKHAYAASFFVILPEIARALDLTNTQIGTLATARSLTGSISNLPAGFAADRLSHRWPAILGIAMMVVGVFQFLMGSTSSYWPILLAGMVINCAIAFWHPPAIAALSQQFASRRGFAIAMHGSGGSIGEALGPIIAGSLLLVIGWQTFLQGSALPAVITGLAVWFLMRNLRGQSSGALTLASYFSTLRTLTRNRALLTVLLVTGGYSMVQTAVSTFLPIYLRSDAMGYSSFQMAGFLAAAQMAGIVSQPFLGFASDRVGRRAVLVPSLLLLGTGVLCVGLVPAGWPLMLTVTLMGAVQFPLMALFLASAMDIVGENVQATTVSLVFGSGTIFGSLSPAIAGRLADAYGVQVVFFYAAVVAALAATLLFFGVQHRPSPAAR